MIKQYLKLGVVFFLISSCVLSFFSCASSNDESVTDDDNDATEKFTETAEGITQDDSGSGTELTIISTIASEKFEIEQKQLIENYKALSEDIILSPKKGALQIRAGSKFREPFTITVTNKEGTALSNQSITVKYPSGNVKGLPVFSTEELFSDATGTVTFSSPIPDFSCNSEIAFYLTPIQVNEKLIEYAEKNSVKLPFMVYTDKTDSSFSISILDYTDNDTPVTTNNFSSSALVKEMYLKGIRRVGNSEFFVPIDTDDTDALYSDAKTVFKETIDYLVFGTVKYYGPVAKTKNGTYTVTLLADISVMNMKDGSIVMNMQQTFFAENESEWKVLATVRNDLIGPAIADYIYYAL